jgi:hypothetical protein
MVLETVINGFILVESGIRELLEALMNDFTYGKSTQTVRGAILQTIGIIAEVHSDAVADKASQLFTIFIVRIGLLTLLQMDTLLETMSQPRCFFFLSFPVVSFCAMLTSSFVEYLGHPERTN